MGCMYKNNAAYHLLTSMETSYPAIGVYGTVDIRSSIFIPRWRVHRFGFNGHFLNLKHFFNCQKHTSLLKTTTRWMADTLRHLTITLYQHSVGKWPLKKIKAYSLIFALLCSIRVATLLGCKLFLFRGIKIQMAVLSPFSNTLTNKIAKESWLNIIVFALWCTFDLKKEAHNFLTLIKFID